MKKKKEKNEEEIPIVFQRMHNFLLKKKKIPLNIPIRV